MFFVLFIVICLWIGLGMLILFITSPKSTKGYTRKTSKRIYTVDEKVPVTLEMTPPTDMKLADDHDVILAIDHSGSMGAGPGSPLAEALRSAQSFVGQLSKKIHIGIVAFDHEAQLLCGITDKHKKSKQFIKIIGPGGGTAIHNALNRCREALDGGRNGIKKTVILFSDGGSDHAAGEKAARLLRNEPSKPQIICVGFGSHADKSLMIKIAGSKDYYIHVAKTEDFKRLFSFLASWISGKMAILGFVQEETRVPKLFDLVKTNEPYPVGVRFADNAEISWAIPLMTPNPVELHYELQPLCPGWHKIAGINCKTTWEMPDNSKIDMIAPK